MMCQFHCSIHGAELKRRKEGAVMMCRCCHNIHGEELKSNKTIRCNDDVSIPLQYLWKRAEKEEKKVQPNLCTKHAKYVTIIPKDVYLAHNIHGRKKTQDELLGLIVDNNNSADETIMITSEDNIIITDNEIKRQEQKRKKTTPHG